jgi:hypothetical protein
LVGYFSTNQLVPISANIRLAGGGRNRKDARGAAEAEGRVHLMIGTCHVAGQKERGAGRVLVLSTTAFTLMFVLRAVPC